MRSLVFLFSLTACSGSALQADLDNRADDAEEQAWWWWASSGDDESSDEPAEPREPGDPDWFDAHCDEVVCEVAPDFDPVAWMKQAEQLCLAETSLVEMDLQRVSFSVDPIDVDDFDASLAQWEYRFVAPDDEDLWGYTYIDCIVDVTAGAIVVDDTFTSGDRAPVEDFEERTRFGLEHALDDIGGWNDIVGGGIRWDAFEGAPELYLVDEDRDQDMWSALTGERDW